MSLVSWQALGDRTVLNRLGSTTLKSHVHANNGMNGGGTRASLQVGNPTSPDTDFTVRKRRQCKMSWFMVFFSMLAPAASNNFLKNILIPWIILGENHNCRWNTFDRFCKLWTRGCWSCYTQFQNENGRAAYKFIKYSNFQRNNF